LKEQTEDEEEEEEEFFEQKLKNMASLLVSLSFSVCKLASLRLK